MTYLSGLKEFIDSWEDRFVEPNAAEVFRESPHGNINSEGTAACGDSPTFTKYHRYFKRSLERGVQDLTIALILKLDCITYSSCQGHFATPDAVMRPRYVAILPKNAQDYERLFKSLHQLAHMANAAFPHHAVKVVIGSDILESEEITMPGMTLFFAPNTLDETLYFQEVEPIYQKIVELINELYSESKCVKGLA